MRVVYVSWDAEMLVIVGEKDEGVYQKHMCHLGCVCAQLCSRPVWVSLPSDEQTVESNLLHLSTDILWQYLSHSESTRPEKH